MRLLSYLWAAPASAVGLLLAPFFGRRRLRHGVLLCEGASWPKRVGWGYRAISFGHVVLAVDELDEATFRHELAHVRQYEVCGILLFPLYVLGSAYALLRGRHCYRDNPFEVRARRSSGSAGVDNGEGAGTPRGRER